MYAYRPKCIAYRKLRTGIIDMDVSMDIHVKSVDMAMNVDMDAKLYIHGKPAIFRGLIF